MRYVLKKKEKTFFALLSLFNQTNSHQQTAIENGLVFETCASCSIEHGKKEMKKLINLWTISWREVGFHLHMIDSWLTSRFSIFQQIWEAFGAAKLELYDCSCGRLFKCGISFVRNHYNLQSRSCTIVREIYSVIAHHSLTYTAPHMWNGTLLINRQWQGWDVCIRICW